jgi:acetate kinase
MKILQNIVLSVALATSMVAFSTSTMANEKKEVASVKTILDATISHIEAAITATGNGEKAEVILAHIKDARQAQKDIVVGALDQKRQKASSKLIAAGHEIKKGNLKEAKVILEEALAAFKDLENLAETK